MNNLHRTPKTLLKKIERRGHQLRAVSPVVATLVLIVVAIVGAISVGLIMSRVSTDTASQANVQGAAAGSQGTLLIGGSTTVYPIMTAVQNAFTSQYHVGLIVSQGGSDAGMQGVISGALDIGAASSASAVNNAYTDVVNNNIIGVTINPVLIGGSGVVVIENGPGGTGGFLTDGANTCQGITKAALLKIFNAASFGITAASCAAASSSTLDAAGVDTTLSTIKPVSRSDDSGTQDQFSKYVGLTKQSSGGNLPGVTQAGNPGVLNYVNTHANTIGFVDLGFAEGAASGAVCPVGWTAGHTCNVSLPQVDTATPTALPTDETLGSGVAAGSNGYITGPFGPASNLHNLILSALKKAVFVNPLTLAGQVAQYPDSAAGGTGLARTFYLVTNGPPSLTEEQFISFVTNYNQQSAYTNNGYFSQYDMTSA